MLTNGEPKRSGRVRVSFFSKTATCTTTLSSFQAAIDLISSSTRFITIRDMKDPDYADVVNLDRTDLITIRTDDEG